MKRGRRRKRAVQGDRSSLSLWVLCKWGNIWQLGILVNKATVFLPAPCQLSSLLVAPTPPTHRHTQRLSSTFGSMHGSQCEDLALEIMVITLARKQGALCPSLPYSFSLSALSSGWPVKE